MSTGNMSTGYLTRRAVLTVNNERRLDENDTTQNAGFKEVVQQTLDDQFLEDKAQKGFTTREKLKYRGIEVITTRSAGAWIRAFFSSLGGVGRLFFTNKTEAQDEELLMRAKFYRDCCKVQEVYGKFKNKPNANFQELKNAYETVLTYGQSPDGHESINQLLEKQLIKAPVGRALLEQETKNNFQDGGGFTVDTIPDVISGGKFIDDVESKYAQGYRAGMSETETYVVRNRLKKTVREERIQQLLSNNEKAGLFLCSARSYMELAKASNTNKMANIDVIENLEKFDANGLTELTIVAYNELILERIQDPNYKIEPSELPPGYTMAGFIDEVDKLAKVYNRHNASLSRLNEVNSEAIEKRARLERAQQAKGSLQQKTLDVNYEQLELILKNNDEDLPGRGFYIQKRDEIHELDISIGENQQAIEKQKTDLNIQIETLEQEVEQLKVLVPKLEQGAEQALRRLNQAIESFSTALTSKDGNPNIETVNENRSAWLNSDESFNKAKENLPVKMEELVTAKAQLEVLNLGTDALCVKHEELVRQITNLRESTTPLLYKDICKLNEVQETSAFSSAVQERRAVKRELQDSEQEVSEVEEAVGSLQAQIQETAQQLNDLGFELNENFLVQELKYTKFKQEGYVERVQKAMEANARLTSNIIKTMRAVTKSLDDIENEQALNQKDHGPSLRDSGIQEIDYEEYVYLGSDATGSSSSSVASSQKKKPKDLSLLGSIDPSE